MTNSINITPEAERDITSITTNIAQQHSLEEARKSIAIFKNQLEKLATSADKGREGACAGTKEMVLTGLPYVAVYEVKNKSVNVIRILYGAS